MRLTNYYTAQTEELYKTNRRPEDALPLEKAIERVLPPQISDLHLSLARWGELGLSPGVIAPGRIWLAPTGELTFAFGVDDPPKPLMQTGMAAEIAAWLVLLDRWMETFVVVARARSVWTPDELAGALTFMTPAFLPPAVVQINPNWAQVAQAVALAVADGPLSGNHTDQHWQSQAGVSPDQSKQQSTDWRTLFQRKSG